MSLNQSVNEHWRQIERKWETMSEALSWSISGRNLQKESQHLAKSEVMKKLMKALANENANSIDRFKMGQYLAQSLEHNPEHNLRKFRSYLELVAKRIDSPRRAEYYSNLRNAVDELIKSDELEEYLEVCDEFKNDQIKEAILAQYIIDEVAIEAQKLMGEYI